jgi:hypothetical protein
VPPAYDHSTLTVQPIDVYVKKGKFSFKQTSPGVRVLVRGRLRGKLASGTISDAYNTRPGVTCKTGTVKWSATKA